MARLFMAKVSGSLDELTYCRLRAAFDLQFQFVGILAPDGEVLEINDLPLKVQGVKREDYVGKKFWDSPAWRDLPEWKSILEQRLIDAKEKDGPVLTEDVFQVKDGSIRYAYAATTAIRDAQGQLIGYVVQATDITALKSSELAHKESEAIYKALFEHSPYGIIQYDSFGRVIAANTEAEAIFNVSESEFLRALVVPEDETFIHEDGRECVLKEHPVMRSIENGQAYFGQILGKFNHDLGDYDWIKLDAVPLFKAGETAPYMVFTSFCDITQSKKADERMRLSEKVFENTCEGIIITNVKGEIVEVNQAFSSITGYGREEILGCNPRVLKSGVHDLGFYDKFWSALKQKGKWSGEVWNRDKSGEVYPVWQNISAVHNSEGLLTHYIALFSDISQQKLSQKRINHMAYHDTLTDLPNRRLLQERVEQAILRAKRHHSKFTLIFIDLDNFKHINDSLGHLEGDKFLKQIAQFLEEALRAEDTVARVGGDEFVLLLDDLADSQKAGTLAKHVLTALQQPVLLSERSVNVTASMGICIYPTDGNNFEALLRNADAAMYRAKDEGRNTYQFYTQEMTRAALERVNLENELRNALVSDELVLYYQPQISLKSGRFVGVEVLLRWQHSERGLISPDSFIPIAEDSGLIIPIGLWVLENACHQAKLWLDKGLEVGHIAVNVAGLQLQRQEILEQVTRALDNSGLSPQYLELEVTEGFIMQHAEACIRQLHELQEIGVSIAIDDFGTGYSSLSYLKQLPIQKLKIDKSFITDIPQDHDNMAISRTIVTLAKSLGMAVIAEGVETEPQQAFLIEEGCQEVQGYLYSPPIPAEQLEQYYRSFRFPLSV